MNSLHTLKLFWIAVIGIVVFKFINPILAGLKSGVRTAEETVPLIKGALVAIFILAFILPTIVGMSNNYKTLRSNHSRKA